MRAFALIEKLLQHAQREVYLLTPDNHLMPIKVTELRHATSGAMWTVIATAGPAIATEPDPRQIELPVRSGRLAGAGEG